jgi:hypothetical protein
MGRQRLELGTSQTGDQTLQRDAPYRLFTFPCPHRGLNNGNPDNDVLEISLVGQTFQLSISARRINVVIMP